MRRIPDSTIRRLSLYLRFLEELERDGEETVSSETLALPGAATSAQVRKDLSFFGSFGKRGLGYGVSELALKLRGILGLHRRYRLAVVGAGALGSALVQHAGFPERGFDVVAIFDIDRAKIGRAWDGLRTRDVRDLEQELVANPVDLGIIAVPGDQAQDIIDSLVRCGIKAVLNFAPAQLTVPDDVALKNVNLTLDLEALTFALANQA